MPRVNSSEPCYRNFMEFPEVVLLSSVAVVMKEGRPEPIPCAEEMYYLKVIIAESNYYFQDF